MAAKRKRTAGCLNTLRAGKVRTAGEGDHNDGGGLLLRVRGGSATWVFRYTGPSGKRREMGLRIAYRNNETIAGKSLTGAREQAHNARSQLQKGIDPIDARAAQRKATKAAAEAGKAAVQRERLTLARASRAYHERVIEPSRTTKHAAQWISTLERNIPPALWHKPIADIEAPDLLAAIADLQARIPRRRAASASGSKPSSMIAFSASSARAILRRPSERSSARVTAVGARAVRGTAVREGAGIHGTASGRRRGSPHASSSWRS